MNSNIKYSDITDLIRIQHRHLNFLLEQTTNSLLSPERDLRYPAFLFQVIEEFDLLQRAEQRTLIPACYRLNRLTAEVDELVEDTAIIQILIQDLLKIMKTPEVATHKTQVLLQLISRLLVRKEKNILSLLRSSFSEGQIFDMGNLFRQELLKKSPERIF